MASEMPPMTEPDKPTSAGFSRTCSLLSRYLKEKGSSLGDLNLNLSFPNNPAGFRSEVPPQSPARTISLFPESKLKGGKDNPEVAPMTIFYAGKVIVFDDFPAEKAKEVMVLASRASILGSAAPNPADPVPSPAHLPIARRASLHRFLEKRKDRVMARAPYHRMAESPAGTAKPVQAAAADMGY
ncbi:hypothetical protein MLD38_005860 [Melastoma candidum]|uniref:Uncharacterized protein n=1 Tax=Melastoma candidum TaxID=119954 RepID=A0ACB9RUH2_9MYRT|nr:hypothetical protein MLD38_005860 [Melastoma candidum]